MPYRYGGCGSSYATPIMDSYCGYGYAAPIAKPCFVYNNCFTLIVVLFILLIIIGASCFGKY
ncbi:YjcZ family sporulation protein [Bacillus sp. 1NLA3E]|uniref:YjcZ family sporulation protein n=1 Tax=Bacillus sp. 1NLA3E TaxID=666686 RepID=UPI000247F28F|nr:YjcZ family sporulation protein [Bacillus sp. 1NLA3E]